MTDVTFTATAAFDRSLVRKGGGSVRYLVARVRAARKDDRRPAERAPLNIALVIDASGSMAGGKLEAARAAALGLAERLTARDRLTVVSFASDVQVHLDAVPVTAGNAARIREEIASIRTRGMTCLSGGWFAGVESAARVAEADPRMTPRVIILSDGHANEGIRNPDHLREHAGELRLRGVLTSALGIGDGYDEQLLRGIAEAGGGRLHDAELTSEISSVLLGELDDIFGTLVEDSQVTLSLPAGVRVEVLGRDTPEVRGGQMIVPLGPVQNEVERLVVFRVTCPGGRAMVQPELEIGAFDPELHVHPRDFVFGLRAGGRAVDDATAVEAEARTMRLVTVDDRANLAQPRDMGIAAIVARVWSAHIVASAARMNQGRAYAEARAYVAQELPHFKRYVEGLERGREMVRDLELLARRADRQLSPRMHKEMVIQTSLAMESRVDRRGAGKEAWSTRMARGE
jgi:Ca-activated chloride channel homolog